MKYSYFRSNYFLPLVIIVGLHTSSCKSQKGEEANPVTPTGTLILHLHNMADVNEIEYGTLYTTTKGRKIIINKAQMYLSGIELIRLDGSACALPDRQVLKVQESEVYELGEVPIGNYKSIRFNVGLNPITNLKNPGVGADTILNHSSMWFGSTAQPDGYIFVNVQGSIDTTSLGNGAIGQMQTFKYQIGTNANLTSVTMPDKNFSIVREQFQYIHMQADYAKLFTGIALNHPDNLSVTSTADNSSIVAGRIRDNIPSMFSYEE